MPLERHRASPILSRRDIPAMPPHLADPSSVFNPGAVRWQGRDVLLLRVQSRGRETFLVVAESADGVHFDVRDRIVRLDGLEHVPGPVHHVYDPRLTVLDGACHVVVALDTAHGCRLGIWRSQDFEAFEFVGLTGDDDTRNGVLFPERVGGEYLFLERPNLVHTTGRPPTGDAIVLSSSRDLRDWHRVDLVFSGRPYLWDERIGAGPPPVKTRDGWLLIYHGVATHFGAANIYQAGVALLDLDAPHRVLARSRCNILEPRETWEMVGQVPNVVFPSGMIVERNDDGGFALPASPVRVYYGAADTVVGLATSTIAELVADARDG